MERRNQTGSWLKKYAVYIISGCLILTLAITILVSGINSSAQKAEISSANNPVITVNASPLTFSMPMINATLLKDFSATELFYNSTCGRWEYHSGIDLTSSDNLVYAMADGVVAEISENSLMGTTVVIKHSDKLKSVYSSLSSELNLQVGDTVEKGDKIGTADNTATSEQNDGKHLHFEILENGKSVDPANYLELENK